MNYLILSDSHGRRSAVKAALDAQLTRPTAIYFLGDGLRDIDYTGFQDIPVEAVRGNCDNFFDADAPCEILTRAGEFSILLMHGHTYNVKGGMDRAVLHAASAGADILLFGHTHYATELAYPAGTEICGKILKKQIRLFNPGSIGYDGSFGTMEIRGSNVIFGLGNI